MTKQEIEQALAQEAPQVRLVAGNEEIVLVRIPPGRFAMGSSPTEKGHRDVESPLRGIEITRPYYIGRFPVTQEQYQTVMGVNPGSFRGQNLPVDQVSYTDARAFCRALSKVSGVQVTLPTEAQWEYACRAGTTTRFYSGEREEDLSRIAWWRRNSEKRVHPVGQLAPNTFGLYDMLGNVWELCLDNLSDYETLPSKDPVGQILDYEGTMRGGGWMSDAELCRAACGLATSDMFGGTGLRIVVSRVP